MDNKKKVNVSIAAVVIAVFGVFAVGYITGWIVYGANRVPFFEPDAAGAVGTWAVGVGAIWIALEAHMLNRRKEDEAAKETNRRLVLQIEVIEIWAIVLKRCLSSLEVHCEQGEDKRFTSIGVMTTIVSGLRSQIASLPWSNPAWDLLGTKGVDEKLDAEIATRDFCLACDRYLGSRGDLDSDEEFDPMHTKFLNLLANARTLKTRGAALSGLAKLTRKQLGLPN